MPSNIDAILVFIVPKFSKSVWFHLRSFLPTNLGANFYYKTPSENIFVFLKRPFTRVFPPLAHLQHLSCQCGWDDFEVTIKNKNATEKTFCVTTFSSKPSTLFVMSPFSF